MTRAKHLATEALTAMHQENYADAYSLLTSATTFASIENDQNTLADAYVNLAVVVMFHCPTDSDCLRERESYASKALSLYAQLNDSVGVARALRIRSTIRDSESHAKMDLEKSLELLRPSKNEIELVRTMVAMALHLLMAGEANDARSLLNDALSIARRTRNADSMASVLEVTAKHFDGPSNMRREMFSEAQSCWRRLNRRRKLATLLADEAMMLDDAPTAERVAKLREARDLFGELGLSNSREACESYLERFDNPTITDQE